MSEAPKRVFDVAAASALLLFLMPLALLLALAIKLDSRGPVLYRCRRVGRDWTEFGMLKFRKMQRDAAGGPLTGAEDERFTRVGRFLARSKLDEIPQLWNVVRGEMSLVGPRPEDPRFARVQQAAYDTILTVRPGITGLTQIAFARESEILDPHDRVRHYVTGLLPQKARLDCLYVTHRSLRMDARILGWTTVAVLLRRSVAVHRETGRLTVRAPRGREAPTGAAVSKAMSS